MTEKGTDVVELMDVLEGMLAGSVRTEVLAAMSERGPLEDWLGRLRPAMASHTFRAPGGSELARLVRRLDTRTRGEGFHVLHAWNHRTHAFTDDTVPVLLLDFLERAWEGGRDEASVTPERDRATLAIALDCYFLHLLSLCAMRVWDTDDPSASLDRLTELVTALQGGGGGGHRFVGDAETLLIYALSQFHPDEHAYDRLVDKVVRLTDPHQRAFASVSASVLGTHLRWGFWLMYDRDPVRMRKDNVGDYPWLLNSLLTLMRWYAERLADSAPPEARSPIAQVLLQGFAADPWAFTGSPPPALADYGEPYAELIDLMRAHGATLLGDFEPLEPERDRYAPLSLHFNFPHNTLVAIVTLALLEGRPQRLPINALFENALDEVPGEETQESLARSLMAFSRGSPDRLGYRGAMLVAYDPLSGMRSFSVTTKTLARAFG